MIFFSHRKSIESDGIFDWLEIDRYCRFVAFRQKLSPHDVVFSSVEILNIAREVFDRKEPARTSLKQWGNLLAPLPMSENEKKNVRQRVWPHVHLVDLIEGFFWKSFSNGIERKNSNRLNMTDENKSFLFVMKHLHGTQWKSQRKRRKLLILTINDDVHLH